MKTFMLCSLMVSSLFLNISCNSDELVAGAIGVGVGVGIGRHYDRHHRNNRRGWLLNEEVQANASPNVSSSTQQFAQRHNLPLSAAQKVAAAFDGLDSNGLASLNTVGLNSEDARSIATQRMPAQSSVHTMASTLGISDSHAHTLLAQMNQRFSAEARDVHSDYWQACMETGTWRTPQNSYCRASFWNGCSPDNGASACY